jgi:hypothetical protein
MSILVFPLNEDFLFEDENKRLYFLRRDILDQIAKDLKLNYFATITRNNIIKDIYYDADSAVVFNYRPKFLDIDLEKYIVTIQGFLVKEHAEVYEDSRHYTLNIRPLLQPYIRNEKIFQLAKGMINNFIERQKYVV